MIKQSLFSTKLTIISKIANNISLEAYSVPIQHFNWIYELPG